MKNILDKSVRRRIIKKSGWIATTISVISGLTNLTLSLFRNIKGNVGSNTSLPWVQSLWIMIGVFVIVFIILMLYYSAIKKKVEEMPSQ